MTTTLSSPVSTSEGLDDDAIFAGPSGARPHTRRAGLRIVLAIVVLVVIGLSVQWAVGRMGLVGDSGGVDNITVEPRSFNVILTEKGELKAARSTDIICEVEGRSTIISLIAEGTAVQKGDLLIELASNQIEDRIQQDELKEANAITAFEAAGTELEIQRDQNESDRRKAQLKIELKHLDLEKYEKGDWMQRQRDAEIAIEQAQMLLSRREENFEAAKQLLEREFITQTQFEEDEFNFKKAAWDLEKARNAKRVLEQYTHVAELRRRQSDLDEAKKEFERVKKNGAAEEIKKVRGLEGKEKELGLIRAQLAKLRIQQSKCRITAPTQGFVVYYSGGGRHWSSDGSGHIKEGASVHERQVLLSLPDTSQMQVIVRVHEAKTDRLSLGQRAKITVEAMAGQEFSGTVTKIAPLADTQNRWLNPDLKEYETEITLDPTDQPLKPSVTAYVEILVETVDQKLAVPVQAVYTKGAQRYVFRDNRGEIQYVPVQLGAVGNVWTEIVDGLSAGDQIVLAFSEDHKRLIPDPPVGQRSLDSRRAGKAGKGSTAKQPTARHAGKGKQRRSTNQSAHKAGKTLGSSTTHSTAGTH